MIHKVRLGDVLSPSLIETNDQHIRDFLLQDGIAADPNQLAATEISERHVKELLAELAHDLDHGGQ